jgi:ribonuclease VapC
MSAANWLEVAIVIDGSKSPIASRRFDEAVAEARIVIETVTLEQAEIARAAYRDFGRGSGHPAQLNFGDCFAYALAKSMRSHCCSKATTFRTRTSRSRKANSSELDPTSPRLL